MDQRVAIWVAAAAGAPGVICLVFLIATWVKLRRLRADQRILLPDGTTSGLVDRYANLSRGLGELDERIDAVRADVQRLAHQTDAGLRGALRFQGLIRYDAYADMGGAQSWSMAILNAERTGAVVTSLHARDSARMYLKELHDGVPSQRLSPEEEQAVAAAMNTPVESITTPDAAA